MNSIIDVHIHLNHYHEQDIEDIVNGDRALEALIGVSYDLASCIQNLTFSRKYHKVKPAFGWHPEQPLQSDHDFSQLLDWMTLNEQEMIAIGEVGLPYYLRKEGKIPLKGYLDRLEAFIRLADKWQKPIILHAIYDDAPLVCNLLEKYSIKRAHFHWFKGDQQTVARFIQNDYFISITPDVLYEEEIQKLVHQYPLERMMTETDGPWQFEGPFRGQLTHPTMIHLSIKKIAEIKKRSIEEVYYQLHTNAKNFYQL